METSSMTNFSFSLFKELSTPVEGNLFVSTYSVNLLLLLLAVGSKTKTNDELLSVLRLPKSKMPSYKQIKSVIEHIEDPNYLTVANGIFVDKAFDLSADYENQTRNYFRSEVKKLDFTGNLQATETEINEWTKSKTNGKISKLFDSGSITQDTSLVLASAVQFKNIWENKFFETKPGMFCLTPKDHINIEMMHQTNYYRYYKDSQKFAALELPYQAGNFEMLIILPDKMDGVKSIEKYFLSDSSKLSKLLDKMTTHKVVLALPKFKFESDLNLEKVVEKLGCGEMLTPRADFSAMSSSGASKLKVDKIKHKTFVEVNEQGTEAAGVTGATIHTYSAPVYSNTIKTVNFHACHPFLFIIKKGNFVVFVGRLSNPNA